MIVKDEAELLPNCLASVQGLVDEMVVLDTGSTDQTVAIAKAHGAEVYESKWPNDFAIARNQALQYVQGEWVLVLDADEVLVPAMIPLLQSAIQNPNLLLINLLRQEIGANQSPYSLISRLFRRHPEIYFARPYHELVDDSVARLIKREPNWQIGEFTQVAILHTGYQAEAIAQRRKAARARTLLEDCLAKQPQDAYVCSKLGALYLYQAEQERGIALLEQGLATQPSEPQVQFELHYHLGIGYSQAAQPERAARHYQTATQQPVPEILKLAAYNNWGNLLKDQGDLAGAKQHYQRSLAIDPSFAPGHYNLGITLKGLGDYLGAIAAYQSALALQPDYAEAHQNLGVVLLKLGKVAESLAAFRQAIFDLDQSNPSEANRLRQGLKEMGLPL